MSAPATAGDGPVSGPRQQPAGPVADVGDALAADLGAGGFLLRHPLAVDACLRSLEQAVRQLRHDGWPVPAHVTALIDSMRQHQERAATVPDAVGNAVPMRTAAERAQFGAEGTVTVTEAAERLGIGQRAALYAVQEGRLPGRKVRGRWQVDVAALKEQVERKEMTR